MDNAGAVVGPLLASAFLYFLPGHYRSLFALTIVPGALAVLLLMRLPEPETRLLASERASRPSASWRDLPPSLWRVLVAILVFTLGNSTDAFLLWRLTDVAGGVTAIPLLWAGLNLIKSATAVIGGGLSDRFDRRLVIAAGWSVYAAVYGGFALAQSASVLIMWFFVYGLYFGLTEGVERALIADFAPASLRGTAFGIYNAALGVGALIASLLFGVLWERAGAMIAFGSGAGLAVVAAVLMLTAVPVPALDGSEGPATSAS
jgi:MFS family permease